ncbi:Tautomerase/MIF [Auricularia subglabra TFB-10046 SS5]|nr:Tautomerase/MIF [Auricularia subglabra TFB-10046 SS5]
MPSIVLTSNVKLAADTLGKPEKYISVSYTYNETLSFSGTHEPAILVIITSLGNISPDANEKYSATFFAFFNEKLGVPGDRGYISFVDPGYANIGYQGTTFAKILGK